VKKYWKESDFMIRRESMIKIDLRMFPPSVDFFSWNPQFYEEIGDPYKEVEN
jgi:hypothetical protein